MIKKFFIGFLAALGSISLFLMLVGFYFYKSAQSPHIEVKDGTVLNLRLTGDIHEDGQADFYQNFQGRQQPLRALIDAIDQAARDERIAGIVAHLGDLNIGLAQAQELREALLRFRAHGKNKFTMLFTETFGEMGPGTLDYYLASAFEEIWVQPLGILGITGIFLEMPFVRQLVDDLKLKPQFAQRKEYKSLFENITEKDFTPANREALHKVQVSIMNQLTRDIAKAREMSEREVRVAMDNAPLPAATAQQVGLIDKVGYKEEFAKRIQEQARNYLKENRLVKNDTVLVKNASINHKAYLRANPMPTTKSGKAKLALIYGVGGIMRDMSENHFTDMDGVFSSNRVSKAIEQAVEDPDVKAIVLRINSGGGSAVASETVWQAVAQAEKAGKPVIISMSDMAASGGYWIATAARKIVAHPATLTGSIGVAGGKLVTDGLWAKFGVFWRHMQQGENADLWTNSQEYSPAQWAQINGFMDDIYNQFLERVSKGRNLPLHEVEALAKGRIMTGEEAFQLGLVDKLGDLKEAVKLAIAEAGLEGKEVPVVVLPKRPSIGELLLEIMFDEDIEPASGIHSAGSVWQAFRTITSLLQQAQQITAGPTIQASAPALRARG